MSCYHYFLICNYYANAISFLRAHSAEIEECCHSDMEISVYYVKILSDKTWREGTQGVSVCRWLIVECVWPGAVCVSVIPNLVPMSKPLHFKGILSSGPYLWHHLFVLPRLGNTSVLWKRLGHSKFKDLFSDCVFSTFYHLPTSPILVVSDISQVWHFIQNRDSKFPNAPQSTVMDDILQNT